MAAPGDRQRPAGRRAFGPLLARRLRARGLPALDVGVAPESHTGFVARAAPEILLLADAVHLAEAPGTLRLVEPDDLARRGTGTHDAFLHLLIAYLSRLMPVRACVLAAQPASLAFGDPPSAPLLEAVGRAEQVFVQPRRPRRPGGRRDRSIQQEGLAQAR